LCAEHVRQLEQKTEVVRARVVLARREFGCPFTRGLLEKFFAGLRERKPKQPRPMPADPAAGLVARVFSLAALRDFGKIGDARYILACARDAKS
jgi:hypothetical protein